MFLFKVFVVLFVASFIALVEFIAVLDVRILDV